MSRLKAGLCRRMAMLLAASALLLAASAAPAEAWRHPSPSEWAQIRNTIHSYNRCCSSTHLPVHVGHVRISTAGPWAVAEAWVILPNGMPDGVSFALHRTGNAWHVINVGTSLVTCPMPKAVRRDLGFTERCPPIRVTG